MSPTTQNRVLVVLPTYNERENIAAIVPQILTQAKEIDILIVDDNSPDGTGQIADGMAANNQRINVLHREKKAGLGRAYIAGFKWGLQPGTPYEFLIEMDADLSHNPNDLNALIAKARLPHVDIAIGSRYCNGIRVLNWPLKRLLLSMGAGFYVRTITGLPLSDPTGGFKCFKRATLAAIGLDTIQSNGYAFQIELSHRVWRAGGHIEEVPIIFSDRQRGTSKISTQIVREAVWRVWQLCLQHRLKRRPTDKMRNTVPNNKHQMPVHPGRFFQPS